MEEEGEGEEGRRSCFEKQRASESVSCSGSGQRPQIHIECGYVVITVYLPLRQRGN